MNQKIMDKLKSNPGSFGGTLMQVLSESNIQSHVWHLQTTVYSQHKALNVYYDCIVGLTDSLIETYQGLHGVRIKGAMNINIDSLWSEAKVPKYFKALKTTFDKLYKNEYLQDGNVKNIMDEIMALIDKVSYLLTLKH